MVSTKKLLKHIEAPIGKTFVLGCGFRILAVEILTLKIVHVTLNIFKSLIGIINFKSWDLYKKNISIVSKSW